MIVDFVAGSDIVKENCGTFYAIVRTTPSPNGVKRILHVGAKAYIDRVWAKEYARRVYTGPNEYRIAR